MFVAEEWLEFERTVLGSRPLITGTVEEVRKAYQDTSNALQALYPKVEEYPVRDYGVQTKTGLKIRVYVPTDVDLSKELLPVGVFAHGGGHVSAGAWSSSFEDRMCRYIVQHAQIIIAQVDFRLAPEFKIPTQVNDCVEAFRWCHENAETLHGDANRFLAIGSSLGGGAAVGAALKLIDENLGHMVNGIVVLCPALLHPFFVPEPVQHLFRAYQETWSGVPLQDGESMLTFYGHNGGTQQRMNPYAFPCLHPGLARLPPVYQAVCGADPVRDDSTVFKHLLDKQGVVNKVDMYPGMPHYFWLWPQLKSSSVFHENVAKGVAWVVQQMV